MSGGSQRVGGRSLELVHHYVGGDGGAALQALLDGFSERHGELSIEETQYDNMRLQVKSRILDEDPPDAWTGWPGGEIEGYTDVNVVKDITDVWESSGMLDGYRSVAADAASVDGRYYAVPITVHRINDLYVHTDAAEQAGIDPGQASDPAEFVEMLERASEAGDGAQILLPMTDPFPVLQLWEVTLLGLADHRTFEEITGGNAARHRDVIVETLELISRFTDIAPEDAIYSDLTDANERFRDGSAPVYPQGDWAGGVFVETEDFDFGREWDRVPFPGTENMYAVVLDAVIPSEQSDNDALDQFLAYAGSADGQERFSRNKGSLPARSDISMNGFSDFGRSQKKQFDRSTEQPQTITHGLSVSPAQLVDLKSLMAEFIASWDVQETADEMIRIFDDVE